MSNGAINTTRSGRTHRSATDRQHPKHPQIVIELTEIGALHWRQGRTGSPLAMCFEEHREQHRDSCTTTNAPRERHCSPMTNSPFVILSGRTPEGVGPEPAIRRRHPRRLQWSVVPANGSTLSRCLLTGTTSGFRRGVAASEGKRSARRHEPKQAPCMSVLDAKAIEDAQDKETDFADGLNPRSGSGLTPRRTPYDS